MSGAASLAEVLATADLVVTCGPGGVGKTTTAAALALHAARSGRRVIVVTVDPARRLADALGLDPDVRTSDPHQVDPATIRAATASSSGEEVANGGEMWALMLDAETTFDRLITEHATTQAEADAILANPVYRSIAGSMGGAQEYMAIERLHQLVASGAFDLVIIDTPPSRHAIDLLDAPERLVSFLGHPIYRALTLPGRAAGRGGIPGIARMSNAATSAFLWAVRRLAGPRIVEDTIAMFRSFAGIEAGLRERAAEVATLLHSDKTAFVLVSSPRAEAIDEAAHLAEALRSGAFPLAAVVINLVHPTPVPISAELAARSVDVDGPLADHLAFHAALADLAASEHIEMASLRVLANFPSSTAPRRGTRNAAVEASGGLVSGGEVPVVEVPVLDDDVHDLIGLTRLSQWVVDGGPPKP